MKPSGKKEMTSDPAILEFVNALKVDDVVEVDAVDSQPMPVIRHIDRFKEPTEAKIGKVVEADVADGVKGPAVTFDAGGNSVVLPVIGSMVGKKWVADNRVINRAKGLKAGTAVLYKTHEEGGKTFVKEITIAPPPTPEPKTAAAEPKMATGKK